MLIFGVGALTCIKMGLFDGDNVPGKHLPFPAVCAWYGVASFATQLCQVCHGQVCYRPQSPSRVFTLSC